MGSIPLPALSIRPPQQQSDPLDMAEKVMQIRLARQQFQDQQAATAALHEWDGKSYNDLYPLVLKHGGSANAVMSLRGKALEQQKTFSDIAKNDAETGSKNLENLQKKNDFLVGKLDAALSGPDEGL